jgi:glutamate-5-semialdehyde dehydrogenase
MLQDQAQRVLDASRVLATATSEIKNDALSAMASALKSASDAILRANAIDVATAVAEGTPATVIDRLRLTTERIDAMALGLLLVAGLDDPVGEQVDEWSRPNGLKIRRMRVPLGVVGVIYENRPNVTSDAAGLALKSGNAAYLRGSSAAIESNRAIASALRQGVASVGLPEDVVALVDDTSRETAIEFMRLRGYIDCLIPRGGSSLIESILENATVPFVVDGAGNCHVYVDADADLGMALDIVYNAKTQRPSVCNAAESLLLHESIAAEFLPKVLDLLGEVEFVGDATAVSIGGGRVGEASVEDFGAEFLDLKMSVAVVSSIDEAIDHIARYGTGHTEAIVTKNQQSAQRFTSQVDAAAVVVNASTRFTDGEQLGFGAEIGISTQKLHARGPMGLRELTTLKYVITGNGQVRS